ncbi:Uncharacterised protein [Mycobacteroides abscessus]|nr:Uncharacterised protein [Mycobacteroides abscessus]
MRSRRLSTTTASVTAPSASTWSRSARDTPSRLPKRMWLRSVWLGVTEMRTRPSANSVVNTTPIAASSLTRDVSRTAPMSSTASSPKTSAPSANGAPTTYASTTPGSTACETASPMRDQPTSTSQHDRTPHTIPAVTVTASAVRRNSNDRGSRRVARRSVTEPPPRRTRARGSRAAGPPRASSAAARGGGAAPPRRRARAARAGRGSRRGRSPRRPRARAAAW